MHAVADKVSTSAYGDFALKTIIWRSAGVSDLGPRKICASFSSAAGRFSLLLLGKLPDRRHSGYSNKQPSLDSTRFVIVISLLRKDCSNFAAHINQRTLISHPSLKPFLSILYAKPTVFPASDTHFRW